jgi:hypothetical protein
MIGPGETLTINSGVTLTIDPWVIIDNQGTINNHGTIINNNDGTIENGGFINNAGGVIINGGTIDNHFIINNHHLIGNCGIINNYFIINNDNGIIINYVPCGSINNFSPIIPIMNVFDEPTNAPLVLTPIGDKVVNEGTLLTITLSASDPEVTAGTQTLSYSTNPPFGALIGNEFTWTPGYGDAGSYAVEFSVSDGCALDSETITITVNDVTDPEGIPEFSTIALPVTAILGLLFLFNHRKRRKED